MRRRVAQHAYFPATATVSLLHRLASGAWVEVAPVGLEGVVGLPIFMGGGAGYGTAVVRSAGCAFRVDAGWLERECRAVDAVLALLLRYVRALLMQVAQTALCNRHHNLGQQVSRRLLWHLDRVEGNRLQITHDQIAKALGVRRSGVTEFALRLQELGVIRYRQGVVTVLDRRSLEQRACECYRAVEQEFERLFAAPSPGR